MSWDQFLNFKRRADLGPDTIMVGARAVPLLLVSHPRARRYLLRLRPDGTVWVTIPWRGTVAAARDFARRNVGWLEQELQRIASQPTVEVNWRVGTEIYFRGQRMRVEAGGEGWVRFGGERLEVTDSTAGLRPIIQSYLRRLAARELPPRVQQLAERHGIAVSRISVRNQRSRWGSCSRRGTISLNWRLIQTPPEVSDYIILHELAHRRQMNHSEKFWQEVVRLCPDYQQSERWLKQHADLLR